MFAMETPEGESEPREPGIFDARRRELTANELDIVNYKESFQARKVQARGDCRLRLQADARSLDVCADLMDGTLNPRGAVRKFTGEGHIVVLDARDQEEGGREIRGHTISLENRGRIIEVKGEPQRPALIVTPEFRIQAGRIAILPDQDDLRAFEGISAVLDPSGQERTSFGFFAGDRQIFITAGEMRHQAAEQRFLFKETVKVWQGADVLESSELVLIRDTGRLLSRPPTRTQLSLRLQQKETRDMVSISAETMEYVPRDSAVRYEKNASFSVRDVTLTAESLNVALSEEDGEILTIAASGGVTIRQGEYEGTGRTALYEVARETITLTGDPVLIDKSRGRTQGDKLTFHMADDRISVENREGKKSVSVIKSKR
jgi:lipopolysaccharide transport protein LptA